MDEILELFDKNDYIGCIGSYNPHERLCTKKCPLVLKCIVEYTRKVELSQLEDIFGEEDVSIINMH
ncbi:MAG: hypothetical protein SWH68_12915 [Thermodesulfobacteriota bacterium]|nr:hypothetical protein [Thermodesulfobacteriota bacterium]